MKPGDKLIKYPPERALEDAVYGHGLAPTRLFRILLPIWSVEIQADVTEGEPYALIDRFLERGIAEAGLTSRDDLADFFGLDPVVVERALRFLAAIGHLAEADGALALTGLGVRSLSDGRRYEVTRQDRRKLYFDAFGSRPLIREYYDGDDVTFLPGPSSDDDRFVPMQSFELAGFRQEALANLARDPHRDRYNLPERVDALVTVDRPWLLYLPMYIVRALNSGGRPRYLAYTQVGDTAEPYMTGLCTETPELTATFEAEDAYGRDDGERARNWLTRNGLGTASLRRDGGAWLVTLPAASFGDGAPLKLGKVGSYVILRDGTLLQVRCADQDLRERALVERVDSYLAKHTRPIRDATEAHIARVARQVDLSSADIASVMRLATAHGRSGLAKQLSRLT